MVERKGNKKLNIHKKHLSIKTKKMPNVSVKEL